MGSRVLSWCISCMSAVCSACPEATVEVTGTDEGKGTGLEQGSVAKAGKSVPENRFRFQGDKEGRQAERTVATCLKVDRPRGAWGRKWVGQRAQDWRRGGKGATEDWGRHQLGSLSPGSSVLNSTLRGRFIGVAGKAYIYVGENDHSQRNKLFLVELSYR